MEADKKWIIVSFVGGVLMIIGTASGLRILAFFMQLYFTYGENYLNQVLGVELALILTTVLSIILLIMAGGGISVIIGTCLVLVHLRKLGRFIIALGSGMGLVGLIIFLMYESGVQTPIETWVDFGFFLLRLALDVYFLGVITTLIARKKIKKVLKEKEKEKKATEPMTTMESDTDDLPSGSNKISCPICTSSNLSYSQFCRKCGADLRPFQKKEEKRFLVY